MTAFDLRLGVYGLTFYVNRRIFENGLKLFCKFKKATKDNTSTLTKAAVYVATQAVNAQFELTRHLELRLYAAVEDTHKLNTGEKPQVEPPTEVTELATRLIDEIKLTETPWKEMN